VVVSGYKLSLLICTGEVPKTCS